MGNIGKFPHRKQGKKGPDRWDRRESEGDLHPDSNEQEYDRNLDELQRQKNVRERGPQESDSHEIGGSRPGVESRVKERLDTLEERGEIRGSKTEE